MDYWNVEVSLAVGVNWAVGENLAVELTLAVGVSRAAELNLVFAAHYFLGYCLVLG